MCEWCMHTYTSIHHAHTESVCVHLDECIIPYTRIHIVNVCAWHLHTDTKINKHNCNVHKCAWCVHACVCIHTPCTLKHFSVCMCMVYAFTIHIYLQNVRSSSHATPIPGRILRLYSYPSHGCRMVTLL